MGTDKLREIQGAFINPLGHGLGGQRILKEIDPEFAARSNDFISGNQFVRKSLREFDYVPLTEFERRPDILTEENRDEKKQRRLLKSIRQSSV